MKTKQIKVEAILVGEIVGESEKAYKVAMKMLSRSGSERAFDSWMPKSRTQSVDGGCWVDNENLWLLDRKYEELESRINAYRRPLGFTARLADGSVETVF